MESLLGLLPVLVAPVTVIVALVVPLMLRNRSLESSIAAAGQTLGLEVEKRKGSGLPDLKGYHRNRAVRIQFETHPNGGMDVRLAIGGVADVGGRKRGDQESLPDWPVPTGAERFDDRYFFKGSAAQVLAVASPRVRQAFTAGDFRVERRTLRWRFGRMSTLDVDKLRTNLDWLLDFADDVGSGEDVEDRLRERASSDPLPGVRVRALHALFDAFPGPLTQDLARRRLASGDVNEQLVAAMILDDTERVLQGVQQTGAVDEVRLWGLAWLARKPQGAAVLASFLRSDGWFPKALELARSWQGELPVDALIGEVTSRLQPSQLGARPLLPSAPYLRRVEQLGHVLDAYALHPDPRLDSVLLDIALGGDAGLQQRAMEALGTHGHPGALERLSAIRKDDAGLRESANIAILAIQQRHGLFGEAGQLSIVGATEDEGALSLPVEPAPPASEERRAGRRSTGDAKNRTSAQSSHLRLPGR